MRVCLACGILNYEAALNAIPPSVIDGWIAFDDLTGVITGRDHDHRAAVAAAYIGKSFGGSEGDDLPVVPLLGVLSEGNAREDRRQLARMAAETADTEAAQQRRIEDAAQKIRDLRHPNAR